MSDNFIFLINPFKDDLYIFIAASTLHISLPQNKKVYGYTRRKLECVGTDPLKVNKKLPYVCVSPKDANLRIIFKCVYMCMLSCVCASFFRYYIKHGSMNMSRNFGTAKEHQHVLKQFIIQKYESDICKLKL